jgi:hypothetical protein
MTLPIQVARSGQSIYDGVEVWISSYQTAVKDHSELQGVDSRDCWLHPELEMACQTNPSQAPSTHQASFEAKLKKALRLNCDLALVLRLYGGIP